MKELILVLTVIAAAHFVTLIAIGSTLDKIERELKKKNERD